MKKQILLYGLFLGLMTCLLKWLEYRFIISSHAFEIYAAIIAVLFMLIGIWAGKKLNAVKTKEIVVERTVPASTPFECDTVELEKRGITQRELEVLGLISEGLSNQEIADRLFVSLNTVKSHTSNLFLKLEVTRRTMAVQKAKQLRLLY